ncbi:MAG: pimeloyl-ACP methyl ester carboxylesterase [Cryomorphaceae bacterium]|jgi:pimeloyl-ACP methyl ester carboxylesterase
MEVFNTLGNWIFEHEALLSGAAAISVLIGIAWSAVHRLTRRVRGAHDNSTDKAAIVNDLPITLIALTAPAPYPIHYAQSDGLRIAYAKLGSGRHDILIAPGIISHLNIQSHMPPSRDTAAAIGEFSKIVIFDKRGQGLSDPCPYVPDLNQRAHDIEAVMDAAGQKKVVLYGVSEGGPMCIKFALDHPERVKGLILLGTTARWLQSADFPSGIEEVMLDGLAPAWGTGRLRQLFFPSISKELMDDQTYKAFERLIATRESVKQLAEFMKQTDVREMLPRLMCPTLVIHFAGDMAVPVRLGRAMAEAIPNAEFVELPGIDHGDLSSAPEGIERVRLFVESLG